jgi:two-component system CheB/CheR fusion protein
MPYRTVDDRIDGVVITFANITAAKSLETTLRLKQADLEQRAAKRPTQRGRGKVGKAIDAG